MVVEIWEGIIDRITLKMLIFELLSQAKHERTYVAYGEKTLENLPCVNFINVKGVIEF